MYYYIPHYGYCGTDNDDEFLCHYGIKGMKWKNHDYKTPEDERYWQIGYNNPVRRTVYGYIGDSLTRGGDLRIKPSKIVTWDNVEKSNRRSPSEIVEDMKWKLMPTPEQLLYYRLNKESKDPFRKYMNHVRGKGLRMYLGSQTKPAVDFLKSNAASLSKPGNTSTYTNKRDPSTSQMISGRARKITREALQPIKGYLKDKSFKSKKLSNIGETASSRIQRMMHAPQISEASLGNVERIANNGKFKTGINFKFDFSNRRRSGLISGSRSRPSESTTLDYNPYTPEQLSNGAKSRKKNHDVGEAASIRRAELEKKRRRNGLSMDPLKVARNSYISNRTGGKRRRR